MTSLIQYEPSVDRVIHTFLDQTEKLFARRGGKSGAVCDFARWLQFYAFDVIGTITYSKPHGFVEQNKDIGGMVAYMAGFFDYAAVTGQLPILDRLLQKNPIMLFLNSLGIASSSGTAVVNFAKERMAERFGAPEKVDEKGPSDLLHKFLEAKQSHPEVMDDQRVLTMSVSMAFAGSETTGISLSALFYLLLKNPRCYQKLKSEIDETAAKGGFQNERTVTFNEANNLSYLDACIKEAFRIFPAAGLPLERVVPPQGATIAGRSIPGGTIVGCSAWVIHREKDIFGEDADEFVPERWLNSSPERLKVMNASMVQFGMGARTCLGKNISLLEIYKLVPSFLRHYDLMLAKPDREWRTHNAWFVRQLDFDVLIEAR
ncbi:putative cytochrome p450 [Phaeomoniella chlamydospora]|uniref:Putative cytochrome p450 n=1 Tax=Phaeomoniella chlamydospora TaxID=158046 RepID=A0A0G2H114_PHACM|nr:putative cytochrome p450 [Phaeomoniella chlamydospora]